MGKRSLLAAALSAAAVTGIGANAALAGEITGNGKWIAGTEEAPLNGRSECAYSGQNDEFVLGVAGDHGRTQSWGQIIRYAGPLGGGPGEACNPTKAAG